jgi:hypothetical protein
MYPLIREKFDGQEFESLAHLVQRVSTFESQHRSLRKDKYLKGTIAMSDPYDADSDGDDPKVATTEWTWGKAPISCPLEKEAKNAYDFDVKKANKIFDLLLEEKQLRLSANHVIAAAKEVKTAKNLPLTCSEGH